MLYCKLVGYLLLSKSQWVSVLTGEGEHRFKVSALGDAGAVFGAGVPQVFKLPLGDDDTAGQGGNLPVVVNQRSSGGQPAYYAHDEPGRFHSRRHDGNVSRKTQKMKKSTNSLKAMKPSR